MPLVGAGLEDEALVAMRNVLFYQGLEEPRELQVRRGLTTIKRLMVTVLKVA